VLRELAKRGESAGFKSSIIGADILAPPDLERIFGLPGGNIFHASMGLDQVGPLR
jgi:phytoene dehydrogenase-like protein